jgi:SAM-dependent methyltransferase
LDETELRETEPTASAAYDALAPHYREYSQTRDPYLRAVDQMVLSRISSAASSWLDVGSGDGLRATRLAAAAGIDRLVLSDPSAAMARECQRLTGVECWPVAAEDLPDTTARFDCITCLWNALGSIANSELRLGALLRMRSLLAEHGQLFLDVNHRYNARAYGWLPTLGRLAQDLLWPSDTAGDVSFFWQVAGKRIHSRGHVFRPREMGRLIEHAGLRVVWRQAIDYDTGQRRRFASGGQLLYELAKQ